VQRTLGPVEYRTQSWAVSLNASICFDFADLFVLPNADAPIARLAEATKERPFALKRCSTKEVTMRGFVIGILLVAVGVFGYLYWDSEHNTVFKAPGVEIKKN